MLFPFISLLCSLKSSALLSWLPRWVPFSLLPWCSRWFVINIVGNFRSLTSLLLSAFHGVFFPLDCIALHSQVKIKHKWNSVAFKLRTCFIKACCGEGGTPVKEWQIKRLTTFVLKITDVHFQSIYIVSVNTWSQRQLTNSVLAPVLTSVP